MNYLVDTNILCELRQIRPDEKVVQWLVAIVTDNIKDFRLSGVKIFNPFD